ncbi:MAG: hypothetical protein ACRD4C_12545, partial [Candidatus Acidiferrales bacterium]
RTVGDGAPAATGQEVQPVLLAVVAANDLWEGILRTAENLPSGTIVAESSAKMRSPNRLVKSASRGENAGAVPKGDARGLNADTNGSFISVPAQRALEEGPREEILQQLHDHLHEIQRSRLHFDDRSSSSESADAPPNDRSALGFKPNLG